MQKLLGLPELHSIHGADVDNFILYVHYLMGVLFIGWLAYFLYALFRFRASKNPRASYTGVQTHASSYIEIAVALVEGVLLVGLAIPLWAKFADDFPPESESTVVRIVASQFAWEGVYPGPDGQFGAQGFQFVNGTNHFGWDYRDQLVADNFTSTPNEIVVPLGKAVIAHITSKDVIHSFKINPFRITQDAIPGMSIPVWFEPTTEGTYMINCAQLCGNSHYYMKGLFRVVSPDEYATYTAEKSAAAAISAGGFE